MPYGTWLSEGAVLAVGVNLGFMTLSYFRSVALLRRTMTEPALAELLPKAEHNVYFHRGALAFTAMALLILVRVYLANLGVEPLALPTH